MSQSTCTGSPRSALIAPPVCTLDARRSAPAALVARRAAESVEIKGGERGGGERRRE